MPVLTGSVIYGINLKSFHQQTVRNNEAMLMQMYDLTEKAFNDTSRLMNSIWWWLNKFQGSEYPIVVMPVLMNHYVMLQRNLLYTGITRAKKLLVIVGTKRALSYAVRNVTVINRNTLLKERLADGVWE